MHGILFTLYPTSQSLHMKCALTNVSFLTAMSAILQDAETSYLAESRAKQTLIDAAKTKLTSNQNLLRKERAKAADLRRKRDARKDLQAQIINLRSSNERRVQQVVRTTGTVPKLQVVLGMADAGLWIDPALLPLSGKKHDGTNGVNVSMNGMDVDGPTDSHDTEVDLSSLTSEQMAYLERSLSPAHFLEARTLAYRSNNDNLRKEVKELRGRSNALERKLKKVVCLSTGTPEDKLEEMIGGLITALESEQGEVDVGKVRSFLRRVEREGEAAEES